MAFLTANVSNAKSKRQRIPHRRCRNSENYLTLPFYQFVAMIALRLFTLFFSVFFGGSFFGVSYLAKRIIIGVGDWGDFE